MARPREFDRDQALTSAMETFWANGFESTSIHELLQRMRLNRGSLYDSFGDKAALFLEILNHYRHSVVQPKLDKMRSDPMPRQAVNTFFDGIVENFTTADASKGCLITNSATEAIIQNSLVSGEIRKVLKELEDCFCEVIQRGQESGEISNRMPSRTGARLLTTLVQGLCVMGKVICDPVVLREVKDAALQFLVPL